MERIYSLLHWQYDNHISDSQVNLNDVGKIIPNHNKPKQSISYACSSYGALHARIRSSYTCKPDTYLVGLFHTVQNWYACFNFLLDIHDGGTIISVNNSLEYVSNEYNDPYFSNMLKIGEPVESSFVLKSDTDHSFHVCLASAFYRRKCLPINLLNCNECHGQNGSVFICWHKLLANEMNLHVSKTTFNANPCINLNHSCVIILFEIHFIARIDK